MYTHCRYIPSPPPESILVRTRVQKWGNSLAVRIPRGFAAETGIAEGSEVEMTLEEGGIRLALVSGSFELGDLLSRVTPDNLHGEEDWGPPAGGEAW